MKFGGTSIQDAASIERAVGIVASRRDRDPLVVVSAMGGTTRELLRLGQLALEEGPRAARQRLDSIGERHMGVLGELAIEDDVREEVHGTITGYVEELGRYLEGVALLQEYSPRTQDAVISRGERFSTALFAAAARAAGLDAVRVDAADVMITDDRFRRARPNRSEIEARAGAEIQPLVADGRVPIVEGFVGATIEGVATTMGFEASDYSAALLGAALGVREIQIWTDVPGMLTTGHSAVRAVYVVRELSFLEAAELALFGAKVLHPDTIEPACQSDIPVRILPSRDPGAEGTRITAEGSASSPAVKSIAVREGLHAVRLTPRDDAPLHRTLRTAASSFDRHELAPLLLAGCGDAVLACLVPDPALEACLNELSQQLRIEQESERSVVCAVGDGIVATPRIVATAATALAGLDATLVATSVSGASLPFVVAASQTAAAVELLHDSFFADAADSDLFAAAELASHRAPISSG